MFTLSAAAACKKQRVHASEPCARIVRWCVCVCMCVPCVGVCVCVCVCVCRALVCVCVSVCVPLVCVPLVCVCVCVCLCVFVCVCACACVCVCMSAHHITRGGGGHDSVADARTLSASASWMSSTLSPFSSATYLRHTHTSTRTQQQLVRQRSSQIQTNVSDANDARTRTYNSNS
jgi:hypothetical protein